MVGNRSLIRIVGSIALAGSLVTCEGTGTEVEVEIPVVVVEVTPDVWTLEIGKDLQLSAIPRDTLGNPLERSVAWVVSDPVVADVDGNGLVTGLSDGTVTVTATSEGVGGTATLRVIQPGAYNCSLQSEIPQAECWALVALQEALEADPNSFGAWEHWLANATPCSWAGVTCVGGSVSELILYPWKFTGSIPAELGSLTNLKTLDFSWSYLTGPIPPELGNLTNLEVMRLYQNDLTGTIPAEFGNLTNLQDLSLSYNHLTGPIPPELSNLTNLERMNLRHNELTGGIPPELGNLTKLQELRLSSNALTGSIPTELGNLTELQSLFLNGTRLTGSIPPELGNLATLQVLDLSLTDLTGPIPPELGNLPNLESLFLELNDFTGGIPSELGDLASLDYLMIHGNRFSGLVPLNLAQRGGVIQSLFGTLKCRLVDARVPGNDNDGLYMPDSQEYRDADLDGDGLICGLGFTAGLASNAPNPDGR